MPGLPGSEEESQLGPGLRRIRRIGMDDVHGFLVDSRRHATAPKEVADEGVETRGIVDVDSHHWSLIIGFRQCGESDPKARSRPLEV